MEFFGYANVFTTDINIREILRIDSLPNFCDQIEAVDKTQELGQEIYFLQWGKYHICRAEVMGGVRFWVPDCPNALAWTITTGYPPKPDKIVIHATINRTNHSQEFIDATLALVEGFKSGIEGAGDEIWPKKRDSSAD